MISQYETNIEPLKPKKEVPSEPLRRDLFKRGNYFLEDQVGFHSGSQKRTGLKLVLWSWMASFIDSLVLISTSCFMMIFISLMLKTRSFDFLRFMFSDLRFAEILMVVFLLVSWVYLISMRVLMGATLGEWSCQLRLGQPAQRIKVSYLVKVFLRASLVIATGIIILPLISLIFKRDLIGDLVGIKIYSLV